MLCSAKELGLAEDAEGILILAADAKVGQPLAEHLGRAASDVVYDLEITPNRPDLNSVIGIARKSAPSLETRCEFRRSDFRRRTSKSRISSPSASKTLSFVPVHRTRGPQREDWAESRLAEEHSGEDRSAQHQQRGGCD